MKSTVLFLAAIALACITLAGCAAVPPERSVDTYAQELGAAGAALDGAKARGADGECPARYMAAAAKRDEAVAVFWSCRTAEAIKMMKDARRLAEALCGEPEPMAETAGAVTDDGAAAKGEKARKQKKAKPAPAKSKETKSKEAKSAPEKSKEAGDGISYAMTDPASQPAPANIKHAKSAPTRDEAARSAAATIEAAGEGAPRVIGLVRFDFDSTAIKPEYRDMLDGVADVLKGNPGVSVEIHGHADAEGPEAYNMDLSERRARAVKQYLTRSGVDGRMLGTVGHGEGDPVADNATREGRAQNRRAEVSTGE